MTTDIEKIPTVINNDTETCCSREIEDLFKSLSIKDNDEPSKKIKKTNPKILIIDEEICEDTNIKQFIIDKLYLIY